MTKLIFIILFYTSCCALLDKNVRLRLFYLAEYSMNIQNGSVTGPATEDFQRHSENELNNVEFVKLDDWVEPVVMISSERTGGQYFA